MKLVAVLTALVLAMNNVAWYSTYLPWRQRESARVKDNAKALATMLGPIASALRDQGKENLSLAYSAADHAVLVAQALYHLRGSYEWKVLLSAIASLRDLIAKEHQRRGAYLSGMQAVMN